jgi:hypothetical protein
MLSTRFFSYFHSKQFSSPHHFKCPSIHCSSTEIMSTQARRKMVHSCQRGHSTGHVLVPLSTTLLACWNSFSLAERICQLAPPLSVYICTVRLPIMSLDLATGGGAVWSVTLHYKIIDWTSHLRSSHHSEPDRNSSGSSLQAVLFLLKWIIKLANHGERFKQNSAMS